MIRATRFLVLLVLASSFAPIRATAQTARVTFYSIDSRAKQFAPHSDHAAFYGLIYDGKTRLATLGHGRRATFILPAGDHSFSASFSKHPAANSQLALHLAEGTSTYVSVEAHVVNLYYPIWITLHRGILTEVDCQTAQKETAGAKPVELKRVAKDVREELAPNAQPITCAP